MIPKELEGILISTADTLSGAIRFSGTRVPVQALLDTIVTGHDLNYFLEGFSNVSREQAEAVLRWENDQAMRLLGLEVAR